MENIINNVISHDNIIHNNVICTHIHIPRASQVALVVKYPPAKAGHGRDVGSVPGLGRFPGEGSGTPLQYSCLENSTDRGAWPQFIGSQGQTRLSDSAHRHSK